MYVLRNARSPAGALGAPVSDVQIQDAERKLDASASGISPLVVGLPIQTLEPQSLTERIPVVNLDDEDAEPAVDTTLTLQKYCVSEERAGPAYSMR